MYTFFLFCAVIAGTIFLLQFVLLLIGFGAEGAGLDVDMHDGGGADFGGHFDAGHGAVGHGGHGAVHGHDAAHHNTNHASTWLFGVISLRTVVAAVTFFGLAGLATLSALGERSTINSFYSFLVALAAGLAAMFGVHFLMRSLHKLGQDGTMRMRDAIGRAATVYVSIPASGTGAGKIQIRMPGGLQEMAATTAADQTLATGSKVRVVGVVGGGTVRVEPIVENAKAEANA
jgi:hypothetical protein